ncbi:TPA: hypothetical protein EYN23_08380 [Candidatus Poribacteria bacterium]|nr:hypothetical protein [Candidatus Poribacteria bacterium]
MFWNSSVTNAKIDQVVLEHLESHIYSPVRENGIVLQTDPRVLDWIEPMLVSLKQWADTNELGKWKRSRIMGDLEMAYKEMGLRGERLKMINRRTTDLIW